MNLIAELAQLILVLKDAFIFVMKSVRDKELREQIQTVKEAKTDDEVHKALSDLVRIINKS